MAPNAAAEIVINGRKIGPGQPVYVIAEMSANHNQQFERAIKIIEAAKHAGADAVKLQTYKPETMTVNVRRDHFRIKGGPWDGKYLYDLYDAAFTPWEWHADLKKIANSMGLDWFSTPFDQTAVDFLETLDVPAYKVASFENVDLALLQKIARTGKPVIVSTGMATLAEMDEAVATLRCGGANELALLKCCSAYPSTPEEMNLRTIRHMSDAFHVPVGLSDHSLEDAVPVAAVSLGACIVEKHLTLSRIESSADKDFSLEPEEFKRMVRSLRTVEKALGNISYALSSREQNSHRLRRSLFVVEDMHAGALFTPQNVRSIRPGCGLHPRYLSAVLGKAAQKKIERGTPMAWDLIGGPA